MQNSLQNSTSNIVATSNIMVSAESPKLLEQVRGKIRLKHEHLAKVKTNAEHHGSNTLRYGFFIYGIRKVMCIQI